MFVAITREIVSAFAKVLSPSAWLKIDETGPGDSSLKVREMLERGDAFLRGGLNERALDMYQQVAEDYTERGYTVQAVAVYKQMLRIDAGQKHVHTRIEELHATLGVSAELEHESLIVEADDIVDTHELEVELELDEADLLEGETH